MSMGRIFRSSFVKPLNIPKERVLESKISRESGEFVANRGAKRGDLDAKAYVSIQHTKQAEREKTERSGGLTNYPRDFENTE